MRYYHLKKAFESVIGAPCVFINSVRVSRGMYREFTDGDMEELLRAMELDKAEAMDKESLREHN